MVNWDIVPKIVTGKNKKLNIERDKMFRVLYKNFVENISKLEKLIIVGYSFSDPHINEVIENFKFEIPEIISINPENNFHGDNVRHINPLIESVDL